MLTLLINWLNIYEIGSPIPKLSNEPDLTHNRLSPVCDARLTEANLANERQIRLSHPNRCTTRTVVFSSLLSAIGIVPYSVIYIKEKLVADTGNAQPSVYFNMAIVILYTLLGVDIVVYYTCNKLFRQVLKDYLHKIFSLLVKS